MCNDCRDITKDINVTSGNIHVDGSVYKRLWQLHSGLNLTIPNNGVALRTRTDIPRGLPPDPFRIRTEILAFNQSITDDNNAYNYPIAFEYSLFPCVRTYSSNVEGTRTSEVLLSTFPMKSTSEPYPVPQAEHRILYWAVPMPCLIDGTSYNASAFASHNFTGAIAVPGLLPGNRIAYVPSECYFAFGNLGYLI